MTDKTPQQNDDRTIINPDPLTAPEAAAASVTEATLVRQQLVRQNPVRQQPVRQNPASATKVAADTEATAVMSVDPALTLAATGAIDDLATEREHSLPGASGQSRRYAASDSRGFTQTRNPLTDTLHKPYAIGGEAIKERFIIEKVLGQGGMGMVCQALDLRKVEAQDDRPHIAIKLLTGAFSKHGNAFISLQREAKKTQALAHPNIITVYDFDRDGDTIFMTMEELDGYPLDAVLKGKTDVNLDVKTAVKIIREIALALEYAHSKGIIHSDLKPGNIFYTRTGLTKVLDFGIARAIDNELYSDTFDAGELHALTPKYASLEMFEREPPNPKDDLYALGLIAGELLCGIHPYNGEHATAVLAKGLKPQVDKAPSWLYRKLIQNTVAIDSAKRTQSASQFLSRLQWAEKGPRRLLIAGLLVASMGVANAVLIDSVVDEIPLADLPIETQKIVTDNISQADTALKFKDYNGALLYLDRAYQVHPTNDDVENRADTIIEAFATGLNESGNEEKQFLITQLAELGEYGFISTNQHYLDLQQRYQSEIP